MAESNVSEEIIKRRDEAMDAFRQAFPVGYTVRLRSPNRKGGDREFVFSEQGKSIANIHVKKNCFKMYLDTPHVLKSAHKDEYQTLKGGSFIHFDTIQECIEEIRAVLGLSSFETAHQAELLDEEIEEKHLQGKDRETFIKARVNQGVFRDQLIRKYHKCCLCGVDSPDLLIASHIKPWAVSEPEEKLSLDNGLLLCPNHDKVFDQGFISFDDKGEILISK